MRYAFFRNSTRKWYNYGRFIFWLGLVAMPAVTSILFPAPVKKLTPANAGQSAPPVAENIPATTAAPPLLPPGSVPLPAFRAWMSNTESDDQASIAGSFFPNEKMYLYVVFPELTAGIARVNVNWISPAGRRSNSAEQVISQAATGSVVIHFWLSFSANGAVTEMLTGKEYKPQVYGQWQAQIFFNGEPLTTLPFLIQE